MELRHLRYFRVVAEELHFGRAAARLHMEPQPLNFQMKQLEREIGFALFDHRQNRTRLTTAGAAFLADVEHVLESAERAVAHGARVARGESGALRIGYLGPPVHTFLIPAIREFRSTYPEVTFGMRMLGPMELEQALNRQEVDLGFSLLPVPDSNFDSRLVFRAAPFLAVPADDPLAGRERVEWADLDGRDAISFASEHSGYQLRIDTMLAEHGVHLKTSQQADSVEAALAFVGVGFGIAVFHMFFEPKPTDKVFFTRLPADAVEAEFGALWRRDNEHPLCARFLDTVAAFVGANHELVGAVLAF